MHTSIKVICCLLLLAPLCSLAQSEDNLRPPVKAWLTTDAGKIKAYYVSSSDSGILLSHDKKYTAGSAFTVHVETISKMKLQDRSKYNLGFSAAAAVLGFVVVAGLTKNSGDVDQDGKTSFFELLLTAIEGSTSSNRKRRRTALIAGATGGTTLFLATLFSNQKLSIVFPLTERRQFYRIKQYEVKQYVEF